MTEENNSIFEAVKVAYKALEDKFAMDIKVLDIKKISSVADYFIIASGNNRNQVQTMADNAEEVLGRAGFEPRQLEGYGTASWILMDYNDIIIHVFYKETRAFYQLERLWADGEKMDVTAWLKED